MDTFTLSTIGTIQSCYQEKFGIPRQPRLVTESISELVLSPPYNDPNSLREIERFSHLWLMFIFHQTQDAGWKPLIRPPRLGGNKRIGVFASRSTFRPNPLGMSAVELAGVNHNSDKVSLLLRGCDLLNGTPIVDIKPYIPYSDSILDAQAGFASSAPDVLFAVNFTDLAIQQCEQYSIEQNNQQYGLAFDLKKLIVQILQLDPRPSYQQQLGERVYAMRLYNFDLRWRYCEDSTILVLELSQ
ncbi:MAG TPA: tRNA (N6-threonylcarbamoyladenosine(37)-N6)-methyltransferase TrmO [Leucothrix mucor]|nr:tRNA (N6-threonylcarbamoyladenosine(37)-N6)-methyltransferase TrmO [Leucothrix mucor]